MRDLRDWRKADRRLRDHLSIGVVVPAIQETYYVGNVHTRVLPSDFVVYSSYVDLLARALSYLVKHNLGEVVNIVPINVEWWWWWW